MIKKLIYSIVGVAALTSCADDVVDTSSFLNGVEKTPIAINLKLKTETSVTRATDDKFTTDELLNAYIKHVTVSDATANPLEWSTDVSGTGVGPRLVNFKVSTLKDGYLNEADNYTNHNSSSTLTVTDSQGLYWDDFSNSASDATDLRTANHALMVYYGYGYNGRTIEDPIALTESSGVLSKWTVLTDQSAENAFKTSDLLFAKTQSPVAYNHKLADRGHLEILYTHAMSKVTVTVVCADGFLDNVDGNFANASVKLSKVNIKCDVSAPTASVTPSTTESDKEEVTMQKGAITNNKRQCVFEAVIAPTVFKADSDNPFLTLTNIDDNNYNVFLTDAIINAKTTGETPVTKTDAWSTKLAVFDASSVTPDLASSGYSQEYGGMTIPGVNYHITVTIKKQATDVRASIRNWDEVNAEAEGEIDLPNGKEEYYISDDHIESGAEILVKTVDKDQFKTGAAFSLFSVKKSDDTDTEDERTNGKFVYSTICSFSNNTDLTEDQWTNTPPIYWPNQTDNYYFRALAIYKGKTANNEFDTKSVGAINSYVYNPVSVSQGTIADGHDVIWANTPRHIGKVSGEDGERVYEIGAAIPPRKGGVPLAFQHIMSKVTFNLEDKNKDATVSGWTDDEYYTLFEHPLNPRLNLYNAKIQISNLYTTGTITIENGKVTVSEAKANTVFGSEGFLPAKRNGNDTPLAECILDNGNPVNLLKDYVMVPQTIPDEAIITITLDNGATYKAQLNKCQVQTTDSNGDTITSDLKQWESGKHYTYTITLSKETITFRAMIKDWEEKEASGNATLEWD